MIMGVLALAIALFFMIRKKYSPYGAIALGITSLVGFFLLDTAVVIRFLGLYPHRFGNVFFVDFNRLFHGEIDLVQIIANVGVFVPWGFFLEEFLATKKGAGDYELRSFNSWRRIGLATMAAFVLSLCIECLQLFLHVGFFELTDLVMNTLGGVIGASLSAIGRLALAKWKGK